MRRPKGFDHRPVSRPREREMGIDDLPEQLTEPIPLVPESDAETVDVERLDAADDAVDEPDADESETVGAAGRLREARRRRRRVERDEVRRFTRHSRRRRRTWIVAGAAVLLLALFVAVGAYSPAMALTTVRVEGTSRIDAHKVADALSGQLGRPLPAVDYTDVKSDLSRFRMIRSYTTEVHPPHTLVVRIVERTPVGLVATGSGFDLVDDAGVVISSSSERPHGYPLIELTGSSGISGDRAGFRAAADVLRAMPADLRAKVTSISAKTADNVVLQLSGGERVVWGGDDRSRLKARVLADLIAASAGRSVSEYDVSSPKSAVVR